MAETDYPNSNEQRFPVNIEDEMRRSYLDYAMSVIIGRALPDVRDGLKPVHRRILYGMYEQGNTAGKAYKKSARIVGDVMGKFHPHGDSAIYDTVVRMAQDFSMRYRLVDGQGNFGSLDGDNPAAMRYTEVRLTRLAEELMRDDIDKETIDWVPNYDGSLSEPSVLPAKFPNLLVNGSSGIAVGMATNIPPHNLGEIIDACLMLIEHPGATIKELMTVVPGPDFPTAGYIHGVEGIRQAYDTGRGIIQVRAKAIIETQKKSEKQQIVVTEIPYMTNKARLIEKIAELVRDKRIEGISDLRDESDREGIRIVVELKRDAIAEIVLNHLYRNTQMQTTFGIIFLAIVNNKPEVMDLGTMLRHFIDHRKEIVVRRTRFELRKAEERAHVLEGLVKALDVLDELIALIRGSRTPQEAKDGLIARWQFSEIQAQAILDMRLQRLTGLEREKLIAEYHEILATIERLRAILASERLVLEIIARELREIKEAYGDARRTEIVPDTSEISIEDLVADEDMVITVSRGGYIKRSPLSLYRAQRRGGKGRIGMQTKEEDIVEHLFVASTHAYVLVFTDRGRMYWLKVYAVPEVAANARGKAIVNLLPLEANENVRALLTSRDFTEGKYVVMATRGGKIKKTELAAFSNVRATGIIAIDIGEEDDLHSVGLSNGNCEIFVGTHEGNAIRFHESGVRPMGRGAAGVKAIALRGDDYVVEMDVLPGSADAAPVVEGSEDEAATEEVAVEQELVAEETPDGDAEDEATLPADDRGYILTITEKGFGKRTPVSAYRLTRRGGFGIANMKVTDKNGKVAGIAHVGDDEQVLLITEQGMMIRTDVASIRIAARKTQGVRIIHIDENDVVVGAVKLVERDDDKETPEPDENGSSEAATDGTTGKADDEPPSEEPVH
ncbi:MAG: DNA gyrase subunit A [Acidobacteria bacterium]|nr:DNA gyrase subunit A [Acidobacteriota bacterium]MBV9475824.1 DNA gyrase subunit A [Acidobacteriota bacterium]